MIINIISQLESLSEYALTSDNTLLETDEFFILSKQTDSPDCVDEACWNLVSFIDLVKPVLETGGNDSDFFTLTNPVRLLFEITPTLFFQLGSTLGCNKKLLMIII